MSVFTTAAKEAAKKLVPAAAKLLGIGEKKVAVKTPGIVKAATSPVRQSVAPVLQETVTTLPPTMKNLAKENRIVFDEPTQSLIAKPSEAQYDLAEKAMHTKTADRLIKEGIITKGEKAQYVEEQIAKRKVTDAQSRIIAEDLARLKVNAAPKVETPKIETPNLANDPLDAIKKPNKALNALKAAGYYGGAGTLASAPYLQDQILPNNDFARKTADVLGVVGNLMLGRGLLKSKLPKTVKIPGALASAYSGFTQGLDFLGGSTPAPTDALDSSLVDIAPPAPGNVVQEEAPAQAPVATGPSQQQAVDALLNQAVDAQVKAITGGVTQADLNAQTQQAMNDLIANYGSAQNMTNSLAQGDQALAANLEYIRSQYEMGTNIINQAYDTARQQIQGYQTQGSQLMANTAAAQQAAIGQAAGGLATFSPGTMLTPEQGNAAGLSDTALGGAGITGSSLVNALGGVAQAQNAAATLGLGSSLNNQLANTALDRASTLAKLQQDALYESSSAVASDAKTKAQNAQQNAIYDKQNAIDLANKVYETRIDAINNQANNKADLAKIAADAANKKATILANLTPAEYKAYTGISAKSNFKSPSWYGTVISGDPMAKTKVSYNDSKGSPQKATVNEVQSILDTVYALMNEPEATDPETAFGTWTLFYNKYKSQDPAFLPTLAARKMPTTASEMVKTLWPSTPKK